MQHAPAPRRNFEAAFPEKQFSAAAALCLLALLALVVFCPSGRAQVQNDGTITGRVADAQGKILPGATLTLTAQDTGRVVTQESNASGDYVFNSVPVGTYTLQVSAPTFADYIVQQLEVHAAGNVTINASLKPASTSISVTVVGQTMGVDTGSATLSNTIDNVLVENLPVDGNNVVTMAALLPGVTDVVAPTTFTNNTGGPVYNIGGSRNNQNLMMLDGTIWNNLYNNTGLNSPPSQALQEVSVLSNGYKAEYGRNVGSVFNMVTKAGSDHVHGQLWDYVQNSAFNAADYISRLNPPLTSHQFGGDIGGPLRKGSLFYFVSFQDLLMTSTVVAQAQTFTLAERGLSSDGATPLPCQTAAYGAQPCANFSDDGSKTWSNPVFGPDKDQYIQTINAAYAQATGGSPSDTSPCVTLLSTQPTTLAVPEIPEGCWNPVVVALTKLTPVADHQISGALPYAVSTAPQPRNDKSLLLRGDWMLGRHTVNARYYQTWTNDETANGVSGGQGIATYGINRNSASIHYGNISDTWVITPTLMNVARAGYKRYDYYVKPATPVTLSTFGANYTQPGDSVPSFVLDGRNGFTMGTKVNQRHTVDEGIQLDDMVSWSHGRHNVQAGVEFLRLQYLDRHPTAPSFVFNGDRSSTDPSMVFLLGAIYISAFANATNQAAAQHDLYSYVQDDWHVLPRLTLNVGLRYELPFPWYEVDGRVSTFIPGYRSGVFTNAPTNLAYLGDPGVMKSSTKTPFKDFAPRFGFSWDVFGNGTTAIRGGAGIFYDAINAQIVGTASPYTWTQNTQSPLGGISEPLLGLAPIPPDYVAGQKNIPIPGPYNITFPDKNFQTPYTQAFNFGIQHQFKKSATLEVNWVGRYSRHLALGYDENPTVYDCSGAYFQLNPDVYCNNATNSQASYDLRVKYPGFENGGTGVLDYMSVGSASYNALQVVYTQRSRTWLTATASYTYSKSIDDSSNTGITNSTDQPSISVHRAVSDFNATHIFNMGYTLHYPPIRRTNRFVRAVANGWGLTGMYSARTGHPFSVIAAGDPSLRDERLEYLSLPASGYAPLNVHRHRLEKVAKWFNTADIAYPTLGTYGDAPRNFLTGPSFILNNMSLMRVFPLSRKRGTEKTLTFHVSAFNVFNTPNLGQPYNIDFGGAKANNSNWGSILATVGGNGAVGTNGRRFQLDATIHF